MSGSNLLFIFTGSIAGFKACEAVSRLVQRGHHVRCVATTAALRFIGPATLEGLTGSAVLTDLFESGRALEHIGLTRWADAVVVCPATANTINRFAAGLADDLPGALFLAHAAGQQNAKPWLIAPAMNPAMWAHPATQAAVEKLRGWGVSFVPVGEGRTACGETGEGRLAEPGKIIAHIEAALARPARRLHVLVTAGGTTEPVDAVRVLTNTSTGATGALIADRLAAAGHEVVLLRAKGAAAATGAGHDETFVTFADLEAGLRRLLGTGSFDAVIHAAAVSDYAVDQVAGADSEGGKITSDGAPLLQLRPNPKLVDALRALSPRPLTIVAFKLTHGADAAQADAAVRRLFARSGADYVVHNDLTARSADGKFPADILRADGTLAVHCPDRVSLAMELSRLLEGPANRKS